MLHPRALLAACVVAAGSSGLLAGAYWFQYVEGLRPCILCLWQRPPHFVAVAAALLSALALARGADAAGRGLLALAALALLAGAGIAAYHAGVELKYWPGLDACGGTTGPIASNPGELLNAMQTERIVRCDEAAWSFLGISMAGWNGLLSLGLAAAAVWGLVSPRREEPETA